MIVINLVPHEVRIQKADNPEEFITIPPSGKVARAVEALSDYVHTIYTDDGEIPVRVVGYRDVTDLPAPNFGTCYIVSFITIVAAAQMGRAIYDLFYPGDYIRDEKGEIVASRYLYQWEENE